MVRRHPKISKSFTVEEANATLPLVRAIVKDLTELSRVVIERRERLSSLPQAPRRDANDPYWEELAQMEEELEKDSQCLRGYVEELLGLGLEPRSVTQGLVDFPALVDGQPAYLCWRLGEPEVGYWHRRDASFHRRQSLAAAGAAQEVASADDDGSAIS
ncbi:MAG: DUF2203 domain-containing protein [Planctomycetes bacterium]|nr:DUF2203 domain-containing protein [Planctomycetota bacterium]